MYYETADAFIDNMWMDYSSNGGHSFFEERPRVAQVRAGRVLVESGWMGGGMVLVGAMRLTCDIDHATDLAEFVAFPAFSSLHWLPTPIFCLVFCSSTCD